MTPAVSVIVPTCNRASFLPRLLAALDTQDYDPYEVIVVDDASTDETPEILRRWEGSGRVVLRQQTAAGSYTARNLGLEVARGEIVAFTDDDCLPQPGWLAALVTAIQAPSSGRQPTGAQGVTLPIPGEITPFTHQIEQTRPGPPYRTCNIAYRRRAIDEAGRFDGRLRWYADNILGLRVRELGPIAFAPGAVVHHPPRPREWRDRATWRARFAADRAHRKFLQAHEAEPAIPASLLPVVLWVLRPLVKQSLFHLRYYSRHPAGYVRQVRPMIREKREMLLAMRDDWRARRVQPAGGETLPKLPERPVVSIVVVSRRPEMLDDLLTALTRQTWSEREVVVVGCGDEIEAVSRRHGARFVGVDASSMGIRRDIGWRAAHGDIVAFTDDDCLPDPHWVESIVAALREHPDLWGVQGRTEAERGPVGSHAVRVSGPDPLYQTCNIAYRAEALICVGGFDRRFEGWFEDTALGARVLENGPIGFDPDMVVVHRAMPRIFRDRSTWDRILRDERLLAEEYPNFYRRTRGRSFLLAVVLHWMIGSPVKTLLRELPRAREDPVAYLALAVALDREGLGLIGVLGTEWTRPASRE